MPRASLLALRKNPRRNHMRFYCMVPAMAIQEQVNRRLEQGEIARTLVAWLNARPEVSLAVCAEAPDSKREAKLLLPRRGLWPSYEAG